MTRSTRIISAVTIGLIVALIAMAMVSVYTMVYAFMGAVSGGESIFDVDLAVDPVTGDWTFTFRDRPKNQGLLGITVGIRLRLLTTRDETISEGTNSTHVLPGKTGELTVVLKILKEDVDRYRIETAGGAMDIEIQIRTLMDLVGMSLSMRVRGEVKT